MTRFDTPNLKRLATLLPVSLSLYSLIELTRFQTQLEETSRAQIKQFYNRWLIVDTNEISNLLSFYCIFGARRLQLTQQCKLLLEQEESKTKKKKYCTYLNLNYRFLTRTDTTISSDEHNSDFIRIFH